MTLRLTGLLLLLLSAGGITPAQSRTNLEVFYSLIDSSLNLLPAEVPSGYSFSLDPSDNTLIYNYVYGKLSKRYPGITTGSENTYASYVLEQLSLNYGEIFRKKFLGDYFVSRNFRIRGSVAVPSEQLHTEFNYTLTDTVRFDDLNRLENEMYPFTRADRPAEPFLEGLLEPVVAIGTAATAVVLFFILRSK